MQGKTQLYQLLLLGINQNMHKIQAFKRGKHASVAATIVKELSAD